MTDSAFFLPAAPEAGKPLAAAAFRKSVHMPSKAEWFADLGNKATKRADESVRFR